MDLRYLGDFQDYLLECLEEEKYAFIDQCEYDDQLEVTEFDIEVCIRANNGIMYPISVQFPGDGNDLELRFILWNQKVDRKVLVDLCNYLMANFVVLRWVVNHDGHLCASYSMTLCDDWEENVPRLIHHLNMMGSVLDTVYPIVQKVLWEVDDE